MSDTNNDMLSTEGGKADDVLSLSNVAKLVRPHGAALLGGAIIGNALGVGHHVHDCAAHTVGAKCGDLDRANQESQNRIFCGSRNQN